MPDAQLKPTVRASFSPGFKSGPREDYFKRISKKVQESMMVAVAKVSNTFDVLELIVECY